MVPAGTPLRHWHRPHPGRYTGPVPELPEVETVARLLAPDVLGREIRAVRAPWKPTVGGSPSAFARAAVGRRVTRLWRRAKYLVFELERAGKADGCLVAHLRMSGRFHVEEPSVDGGPWCRLALTLDDGRELRFVDVRKFGRVLAAGRPEEVFGELGPEPLSAEFAPEVLLAGLRAKRRHLKPLLLDQSFVAGLGNIYVDESLFQARLHPLAHANRVSAAKARALHAAIQETLSEAIQREGSSFDTFYRTPNGQPGAYQHQFLVYGRGGKACHRCGATIRRLVVGQRGTHICPRCQPAPRSLRRTHE